MEDKYKKLLKTMKIIAEYSPKNKQGLINTWSEAFSFYECKKIANNILKELEEDK